MDLIGMGLVLVLYGIIFLGGLAAFRKLRSVPGVTDGSNLILANRGIGIGMGISSLVATEVGGAFINGSAEAVYRNGLLWCIAPIGYSLSMVINACFFVRKIRENPRAHLTLIDCLQEAYGELTGALVYLPSCLGDICWTAAVLSALGGSLEVLLGVDKRVTIVVSAVFATAYTLLGGMYAVVYTDAIQLVLIFFGLLAALPFALFCEHVSVFDTSLVTWTGTIQVAQVPHYLDTWMLVLLGGIPWQPYYQRALSMKTTQQAVVMSMMASVLSLTCLIPPVVLGITAKTWSMGTASNQTLVPDDQSDLVLPLIIYQCTPRMVTYVVMGSLSAAVMSSVDSSILAGASYISHNIVRPLTSTKNEKHTATAFRLSVILLAVMSTVLAIHTDTVYGLWVLAGDWGFVLVFPLFLGAVHFPQHVNKFGAIGAALTGLSLRLMPGEPLFGFPGIVSVPTLDDGSPQWPIKTATMVVTLLALITISRMKMNP
ncbi:hypothetical protein TCAL_01734 [Tigriopus californicus]|uniref:Uncharacterized protein n=1 Tax=Tigriopus californicus TaxID=6832 RepID=A0A553PL01_TIGCA|nr:high-affinity choline transporter 1-like [Tigriopus californicus]TRY78353.1 hypothetical protein TCAL_01734 [Tigriopus californicus]